MVEQIKKPLFSYLQEDKELFHQSFSVGRYFTIVDKLPHKEWAILVRMRRRGEKLKLDWADKYKWEIGKKINKVFIGDVLFTEHGCDLDDPAFFEKVGSMIVDKNRNLSSKERKKIIKKIPKYI